MRNLRAAGEFAKRLLRRLVVGVQVGRGVAVEPEAVGLELARHVGQLRKQPVGVAAADVGEVGRVSGLPSGNVRSQSGWALHEGSLPDGHLHGADVENRLGPGGVAALDVRSQIAFGLLDPLGRIERSRRADDLPPAQRVERDHVVAGLDERLGHRQAARQMADPPVRPSPLRNRPSRPSQRNRPRRQAGSVDRRQSIDRDRG